jgi:hypothetical protein
MCVLGGVEMYIAKHSRYVIKRMPGSGPQHHPSCDSFEPEPSDSGRGAMVGSAILTTGLDSFYLRVDFPLTRSAGRSRPDSHAEGRADVSTQPQRMSLHALMHFLFEQAGFHRWSPAMTGRRHQGVLHKYLIEAASDICVKGGCLADRLYVPEAFDEATKVEIAARRHARLAILRPAKADGQYEMAVLIGEFKDVTDTAAAVRMRIRHMADAPLLMDGKAWRKLRRKFDWMFHLAASEVGEQVRIVMCMLVYAKQEHALHVDTATCMLTSKNWIPLDAAFEADVAAKLTAEERRFLKPLRYDAKASEAFPNFLLLDTGSMPTPLHVLSGFMGKEAFAGKEKAIVRAGPDAWVWRTSEPMPALPTKAMPEQDK